MLLTGIAVLVNKQKYFLFADVAYFVQQTCISYCLAKIKKNNPTRVTGIFISNVMVASATFEGRLDLNGTFQAFNCIDF